MSAPSVASDDSPWRPAPPTLSLTVGDLDIWLARIEDLNERMLKCLSNEERQRGERFRHAVARTEFLRTRAWLRHVLARYLQASPERLQFAYGPQGKPRLTDAEEGRGLCFNVSHSHGSALAAIIRDRLVGVDVEKIRADKDLDGLAKRYFSANEVAALQQVAAADRSRAFFLAWTRKEAFIKALGSGMAFPLDAFDVSLAPGEPAALLAVRSERTCVDDWSLVDVELNSEFAGAAAVHGRITQIRLWHL